MQMVVGCQDYDFRELEKVREIMFSLLVVCQRREVLLFAFHYSGKFWNLVLHLDCYPDQP